MQGSLVNFLSPARGGLACSRLASRRCPRRAEWLKRGVGAKPEVGMPFAHADGTVVRPKRRCVLMEVLLGVDPHKGSVDLAAVYEATGELLEHASFLHDRSGLRALERWAKRFPERRWAMENARGLGRHLAGRLAASGECVVDVPPQLSARGCACSLPETPARTTGSMPWPPRSRPRATKGLRRSIPRRTRKYCACSP